MTTATTYTARRIYGRDAITAAEQFGLALNKFADPIEDARTDLTSDEAEAIAAEDPSLIWVEDEVAAE